MESNNKIQKEADFWGAIVSIDNTDADQRTVSISYPDEQIYAQIYMASNFRSGGSGGGGSGSGGGSSA